ncbi:hypothetical protein D9756_004510 [Leucocoprinus leucothites]|uniref:Uncharacterized protein n=1 Tax=Leucocoprinus leucothites TaxID=201217 RepID=A0A8H5G9U5_9AGAR|nr:hypothetical protein D9756_004510 [Leucoagaricus leucothites]
MVTTRPRVTQVVFALVVWFSTFVLGSRALQLNATRYLNTISEGQKSLFTEAIDALEANFAPPLLFDSPRYSAWFAVGLLARNEDDDIKLATALIQNALEFQFKDPSRLWFGTFKNDPNAPDPGPLFPPNIYNSYDPNNALFVCTSWIIIMEEFQHLLDPSLVMLMKESMYNATVGDGYRVGGVDGDNLFPIYSNPWYGSLLKVIAKANDGDHWNMRAKNMSMWGDTWAQEAITEFERFNTLSEFNSGTYAGVTLYALSLYGYMPKNSVIAKAAPGIITRIWATVAEFYNPSLCTLGGPWDRSYGFDMREYFAILGGQMAGLIRDSRESSSGSPCEPIPTPLLGSQHFADVAAVLLTTLLSKFHDPLIPPLTLSRLTQTTETPHLIKVQAVSPPFDNLLYPRNYTSWNEEGLSVGGVEFDMAFVGGASVNPEQFTPAVLLWKTGVPGRDVGWISHHVTWRSVSARASPDNLTISYLPLRAFPDNSSSVESNILTLLVSGIPGYTLPLHFGDHDKEVQLPGLKLRFSGSERTMSAERLLRYGDGMVNGLSYYNLTYIIPPMGTRREVDVLELVLGFEKG